MLRLKKSALTEDDGKFYYKGDLFSGVAFTMNEGKMVSAIEVSEGVEIGKYFSKYFPESDYIVVDIDLLDPENEDDYEPFLCLNGERFSGIALEFDGTICTGELLYVNGWSDLQAAYYKTGRLESINLVEDGFSQIYQRYENDQLKKYEITVRNLFSLNMAFDEDGSISAFGMEGDYFHQVNQIPDRIAIPTFKSVDFLDNLKAGQFISLSGSSVTDELFKRLFYSGVLEQTKCVSLFLTSLTKESLYLLQKDGRLNKLLVKSNAITLDEIKSFKSNKPYCHVELNGEEVLD